MYFHGTSGQLLETPEFGAEDHRYLLAHRASLNNLLAESVGYDNIRLEATVAGFEEDQDRVTVRFTDGSTEDADLLIGADGLYSKVRTQLFPGIDAQENTPGIAPGGRSSRLSTSAYPTTGSSLAAGTEPEVDTSAPPTAPCSGCCRSSARRHRPHR
jgi:2-polyprenyl-6-methoxyphenol hydroxylase-like FAD-dependent oxidoreductase